MTITCEKKVLETIDITDCGICGYKEILLKQQDLVKQRQEDTIGDIVLLVEHRPVITLGANQSKNKLLVSTEIPKEKNVDVVETSRGGGATAHNPGQLVFYPILNLKKLNLGVTDYVRTLEQIGIDLLDEFNLKACRRKDYPGLWVEDRKIASIGIRVSKGVTYHGMAININNDLSIFDYIVPCGIENITMTSVFKETGITVSMNSVKKSLSTLLLRYFS